MRNFAFNFLALTITTIHWISIGLYTIFLKDEQKEYAVIAFVIAVIISAICYNNNVEAMKRLDDE